MEGVINRVARLARLGYFCCLGLVILAIFTINPVSVSGDEANATTGTATSANTSLSLTTNHDNAVVTITPNSANGTFAMSSTAGEAQFGVTTNNFTGYELSIVADDDNGNLVNIDNGITHTISSIPSSITKSSFDTTTYNNKWGFKPNKYLGPNSTIVTNTGDSAVFLPSPTTTGTILDHTTVANSSANNYSIALGVRADYNTYAGSYTKNFTLAAIANPTTYIIDYNKNTSDTVTNMPAAQSSATSATSITLASNTPERDGYNFLGWCTVQTADNTCSGTTYQPGDTYGIDQTAANTAILYAMWGRNMSIQDVTSMQHFGSLSSADRRSVLSSMTTGQAYELVDTRDSEVYNIAKLADGRVWLLDNLRLDLVNVSLADLQGKTNASDTSLNYLKNGGRSAGDNYPTSGVAEWANSNYYYNYSYSDPLIASSGDCVGSDSGYCANDPTYGQWTKDSLLSYGNGMNKVGIYYNSCAASAGSYCYGNGTSYGSPSGYTTSEDICPAGWHIPAGGSDGDEYKSLSALYGGYSDFYNVFHATPSGYFNYGYYSGYGDYAFGAFYQKRDRYFQKAAPASTSGRVVRCALTNPIAYSVSYNQNTVDTVSRMPSMQTGNTEIDVTISSNRPARAAGGFLGWCDTQPTASNGVDSCSGTTYQPGDSISYAQLSNNSNITLYVMWVTTTPLQNITPATCPAVPTYTYDARDSEVYTIQKLADDKCWLLDNLRLNLADTAVQNNLNSSTTNASDVSLGYLKNGGGTTSDKYASSGVQSNSSSNISAYSDPLIATNISAYSVGNGTQGVQWTKDTTRSYSYNGNSITGKLGIYYNFCAASAGSYCHNASSSGDATEDICPAGWRMPKIADYDGLLSPYNRQAGDIRIALHMINTGYSNGYNSSWNGEVIYNNDYVLAWSSSPYSSSYDYGMYSLYTSASSGTTYNLTGQRARYYKMPVRCIAQKLSGYSVSYDKNTTDDVTNMPSAQNGSAEFYVAFSDNIPRRANGGFLGWCDVRPATSNGVDSCSGNAYKPGDSFTINHDQPGDNTKTLYAMWTTLSMQSTTLSACPTTPTLVYDNRDGEVYTIQKLIDDKCWLLDNLRLDLTDSTVKNNLSSSNTNASDTSLNYLKNGGGTTSDKYATAGVQEWANSSFASSNSYSDPLIATSGSCYSSGANYCADDPSSGKWTKDSLRSYGDGQNKIGIYYNFCAASAGSYCYGNGTSYGSPSGDATEDICPAGWRMPTGGATGEYQTLYTASSSGFNTFTRALRAAPSGHFYSGLAREQGAYGYGRFWASTSSTTYNTTSYMTFLSVYYYSSRVYPDSALERSSGYSVRCVLNPQVPYVFQYNKSTNDAVSDMPSAQSGAASYIVVPKLSDNIPTRSGYSFIGWCNTLPTATNGVDSCSGTTYYPGQNYAINYYQSNVATFYAMWVAYSSMTAMQNITLSTCPATPTYVYDSRDNEVYTIQKLADGKCWLLDNLRIDLDNPAVQNNLTSSTTNASDATLNYLKNGGGTASDKYAMSGVSEVTTYVGSYSDPIFLKQSGYESYGGGMIRKGTTYNFCAASAGSYCYGNGTNTGSSSGDATEDICPAGWHIPTGYFNNSDYKALYGAYSNNAVNFKNAFRAAFSGDSGWWWSSSRYNFCQMYGLRVDASGVYTSSTNQSRTLQSGLPIRCVLK